MQVEASKSDGWEAEAEEEEEEGEEGGGRNPKLKRPLSIFGLSPPTCTTSDERHCTQCGGSSEGGREVNFGWIKEKGMQRGGGRGI